MSLERSPSQRVGVQHVAWTMRPSGFSDAESDNNLLYGLLSSIDAFVVGLPAMQQRIDALKAKGQNVEFLEKKLKTWAGQAQRGLDLFADWIEKSTGLQSIIDNMIGAQTATPGLNAIRIGAWREFVSELRPSTQVTAGLGFVSALVAFGRALLSPAVWAGVKNVLMIVIPLAASAAPWIFGAQISDNIRQTIQGADTAKDILEKCLAATESATTTEQKAQVQKLCANATPSNFTLWLLLGGAAGVGALLYFQGKRSKNSVQSRSAALSGMPRKRRRRK